MSIDQHQEVEINKYRDAFRLFDKDNSGKISSSELLEIFNSFGYDGTDNEIKSLIDQIDSDGNNEIDFDEFIKFMLKYSKGADEVSSEDSLRQNFRVLDLNGDGYITTLELHEVLNRLGMNITEKQVSDMISSVDVDGDGRINYHEFLELNKTFIVSN